MCDFFLNANTGYCRRCGQKRLAYAMRDPAARRWIAAWQDRLRFSVETAAGLPETIRYFDD